MTRTFFSILALCALLAAAACTDITGPAVNDGTRVSQDGGKHRNPGSVASPDEITPGDGSGGGDGSKDPVSGQPGDTAPRDPSDLSPSDHNPVDPRAPRPGGEINP